MDRIGNNLFNSDFVSYPTNYSSKQKTPLSVSGKNFFEKNEKEINKEISAYLDILYTDSDEKFLSNMDKLKLNNAYCPMKTTKLHFGNFYI